LKRKSSSFYQELTRSEREVALKRPGVGRAAFLIRDAILGEVENPAKGAYNPYANEEAEFPNVVSVICRRICAMRSYRHVLHITVWILVLLSLFEPPSWCRSFDRVLTNNSNSTSSLDGDDGLHDNFYCAQILSLSGPPAGDLDSAEPVQYYPNFGAMLLTRYQGLIVETFCVLMIVVFILLRIGRDGISITRYLRPGPAQAERIIEIVAAFGLIWVGRYQKISLPHIETNVGE
jgi:hypothetical protein